MSRRAITSLILVLSATLIVAAPAAASWGARAAAADRELTLADMLRYAIEDEYLARAEYAAIMAKFGQVRPFANIIKSEESHISWLVEAYGAAKLPVPKDEAGSLTILPATMKAALEAGVQAEIDNIAMYDTFLSSPLMSVSANAALRDLFTRLRDASKNHLSAFQTNLAKY